MNGGEMKTAAMKMKWQRRIKWQRNNNGENIGAGGENNRKRNGMASKKPAASMKINKYANENEEIWAKENNGVACKRRKKTKARKSSAAAKA
jgi:hypothetical protein